MAYAVKIHKFDDGQAFGFAVEAFQFSKFHENEAKHNKLNCKRGLTVP